MKPRSQSLQQSPLQMVTSSKFGRYPKISNEKVYNMFISDEWLVNYAGYKKIDEIEYPGKGRGLFNSTKFNHLIMVIDDNVYIIDNGLSTTRIATIETYSGDVFIAENDANQIAICDKKDLYIFNYVANTFVKVPASTMGFTPGYIDFQNGYFIAPDINNPSWHLSAPNDGTSWPVITTGRFQTKPDNPVACVRAPGRGNQLFVIGKTVTEIWTDVGYQLFPYQRNSSVNIDYGCLNAATIAASDTFIIWLGSNEKSGLSIMYSSGGDVKSISTDGINYKLSQLKSPESSYGFLFKQDGHLFYQLTFSDPQDNLTLVYDFNTDKFFFLCDEDMNHHIAKRMAYFNNNYYFVSFTNGNLYKSSSDYTTYDGKEIPRIVVCPTIRSIDNSPFVANSVEFTIEQGMENEESLFEIPSTYKGTISSSSDFPISPSAGDYYKVIVNSVVDNDITKTNTGKSFSLNQEIVWNSDERKYNVVQDLTPRVDISISRDGGYSFGNSIGMMLNKVANRKNRFVAFNLGYCNEFTPQFRMWGTSRFVVNNGLVSIYQ